MAKHYILSYGKGETCICSVCGPTTYVLRVTSKSGNRTAMCKTSLLESTRRSAHKTVRKAHGLTGEQALEYISEHGPCNICGSQLRLVVDHDHSTGKIRGVLCTPCNLGIGNFKDSVEKLQNAIKYLEDR